MVRVPFARVCASVAARVEAPCARVARAPGRRRPRRACIVHRVREAKEALSPPPSLSTRLVGGWYREAVVRRLNTTHTRALTRAPRHGIDHLLLYAYE